MRESLGSLLVKNGVATDQDVKAAIQEGQRTGEPIGKVLVRNGVASETQVGKLLAEQWELPYVEADDFEVDEVAALRISRDAAARMGATPIAYDGNTIVMAIVEPHAELFARVSRELGEAAYIVVSRSTFEDLTGGPLLGGQPFEPSTDNGSSPVEALQEPPSADEQHADPASNGAAISFVEPVEVEPVEVKPVEVKPVEVKPVSSDEPIEARQESSDKGRQASKRLDKLEQMFNEVLPLLRAQLTEQHAALADAEDARKRDAEKIRELESELSRQGDLFEALRGQAAALAATFDEAAK